jgi:hypothetical protein
MIRSMEGFAFASALDLNMGYYHIKLDADAQKLCTIVFPWLRGKYIYKRLPMGIKIAPDVFQNVMSNIQIQTLTHGYQDRLVPDVFSKCNV